MFQVRHFRVGRVNGNSRELIAVTPEELAAEAVREEDKQAFNARFHFSGLAGAFVLLLFYLCDKYLRGRDIAKCLFASEGCTEHWFDYPLLVVADFWALFVSFNACVVILFWIVFYPPWLLGWVTTDWLMRVAT